MLFVLRRTLTASLLALCISGPTAGVMASERPDQAAPVQAAPRKAIASRSTSGQVGIASFYGNKFQGRRTASGEAYRHASLTAAHKTLAFGRKVRVTSLTNGRSVVVRINDRGPFVRGRVIDLSQSAARQIGLTGRGLGRVRVQPL